MNNKVYIVLDQATDFEDSEVNTTSIIGVYQDLENAIFKADTLFNDLLIDFDDIRSIYISDAECLENKKTYEIELNNGNIAIKVVESEIS